MCIQNLNWQMLRVVGMKLRVTSSKVEKMRQKNQVLRSEERGYTDKLRENACLLTRAPVWGSNRGTALTAAPQPSGKGRSASATARAAVWGAPPRRPLGGAAGELPAPRRPGGAAATASAPRVLRAKGARQQRRGPCHGLGGWGPSVPPAAPPRSAPPAPSAEERGERRVRAAGRRCPEAQRAPGLARRRPRPHHAATAATGAAPPLGRPRGSAPRSTPRLPAAAAALREGGREGRRTERGRKGGSRGGSARRPRCGERR